MKEKGFTLIELLAVIVILSVITLITIPMITNVIEESKKKAFISSVEGLVESANLYAIGNDGVYEFLFDKEHKGSTKKGEQLDYRGSIDGEGKLYLDKEGNVSVCISNDTYYAYKNYNSGIIIGERSKDNCDIEYDALTNKYVAFLESEGTGSNVYSKEEVDNLVDNLDTKINNNTNEISNIKNNIEELQNNLDNYALQSELNKTNNNLNTLSSLVSENYNEFSQYKEIKKVPISPNTTNFTGGMSYLTVGNVTTIIFEITPIVTIQHGIVIAENLPIPVINTFFTMTSIDGKAIPCVLDTNGKMSIYYPKQTTTARFDFTLTYISK